MKRERGNAVNVKVRCALLTVCAVFHRAKPRRILPGTEAIFICRYDSEKQSKCLYKVSRRYDTPP